MLDDCEWAGVSEAVSSTTDVCALCERQCMPALPTGYLTCQRSIFCVATLIMKQPQSCLRKD